MRLLLETVRESRVTWKLGKVLGTVRVARSRRRTEVPVMGVTGRVGELRATPAVRGRGARGPSTCAGTRPARCVQRGLRVDRRWLARCARRAAC